LALSNNYSNEMSSNRVKNLKFRIHAKFKEVNQVYIWNTDVVIAKNVILNIENICYDKFKEKWYNYAHWTKITSGILI
jgi:hypothetical protein